MYIVSMAYIQKKRLKGHTYYYLAETQRVKGKPRVVWQRYLGTAEKIKEMLLGKEQKIKDIDTLELGSIAALESIEQAIRFQEIVDEIVPKRHQGMSVGEYLYLIVLNRAVEPKSKASLGAWLKKTAISEYRAVDFALADSANFWDHMEKVSREQIEAIGDAVARRVVTTYNLSLDCLLYDTTNDFTQMSPQTSPELSRHTYSKAGKHELRHVGLALLCNRKEGIPLFHRLYPANIHDSKLFGELYSEMFQLLLSLKKGKEQLTLVFDKGNNSPENMEGVDRSSLYFVGTLSPAHHPALCQVPLSEFKEIAIPEGDEELLFVYRTLLEVYGKERAVVVTYNSLTYRKKVHWMNRTIRKTKKKLQELKQELKIADGRTTVQSVERKVNEILADSHIAPVFAVKVSFDERKYLMSIRTNPLVLKEHRARFGKNILFTDHVDWSTEEIVLAYRDRYKIEGAFRLTKDPILIRWQPMYHWTDSKIRLHSLTCVMALLYLSLLKKKLKDSGIAMSLDRAMEILRDIRLAFCYYPRSVQPVRKVCRLSSAEEKLLTALSLKIEADR